MATKTKEKKTNKGTERVKELQDELVSSASKIWLAGLGALSTAEEEGTKLFKSLVEKGEAYETKGRETVDGVRGDVEKAVDKARGQANDAFGKVESRVDEAVSGALKRFGVPTRDEIATLTKRVEELTRLVESLKEEKSGSAKKSTKKSAKSS